MQLRSKYVSHFNRDTSQYFRQTLQPYTYRLFEAYTLVKAQNYSDALNCLLELQCNQQEYSPQDVWYQSLIEYHIAIISAKVGGPSDGIAYLEKLITRLQNQIKIDDKSNKKVTSQQSLICKAVTQQIIFSLEILTNSPKNNLNIDKLISKLAQYFDRLDPYLRSQVLKECCLLLLGVQSLEFYKNKEPQPQNLYELQFLAMYELAIGNFQKSKSYMVKAVQLIKEMKNRPQLIVYLLFLAHINQKLGEDVAKSRKQILSMIQQQKIQGLDITVQLTKIQIISKTIRSLKKYFQESPLPQNPQKYRVSIVLKLKTILYQLKANWQKLRSCANSEDFHQEAERIQQKIMCLQQLRFQLQRGDSLRVLSVMSKYKFPLNSLQSVEGHLTQMFKLILRNEKKNLKWGFENLKK